MQNTVPQTQLEATYVPNLPMQGDITTSGSLLSLFFFFNDTATTEIYTLSLHDALPICQRDRPDEPGAAAALRVRRRRADRSEEHTSELQSRENLVCRLLLEKKKKI